MGLGSGKALLKQALLLAYRPIFTLRQNDATQVQLRMSVAKDELLPGIIHLECRSGYHISLATGLQGLTLTF